MTAIYRGMDRATLDAAYDNTAAVSDSQAYRARWWEASAAVRAEPRSRLNLRYGTIFPADWRSRHCLCSFTAAIGNAMRKSASPSLCLARARMASTWNFRLYTRPRGALEG
jgi:hypothetical protein